MTSIESIEFSHKEFGLEFKPLKKYLKIYNTYSNRLGQKNPNKGFFNHTDYVATEITSLINTTDSSIFEYDGIKYNNIIY